MSITPILHVGVAKSGTTTLQHNLFCEAEDMLYIGKPYTDRWVRKEIEEIKWRDTADLDLYDLKSHIDRMRNEAEKQGVPLVLSEESLTSPAMKTLVARRLREVFGDAKILITLRNQIDSIESYYTRQGRTLKKAPDPWAGRYVSFENWFDHCMTQFPGSHLDRIRYSEVLDIYADVFGKDRVYPLLFEDMVRHPTNFAGQLEEVVEIPAPEIERLLANEPANTRSTARTRQVHRYESSIPSPIRRAAQLVPGPAKALAREAIGKALESGGKDSVKIDSEKNDVIHELYAEGNRKLVDEWGLDLERAGYPM